jgi:hypothetical protein
VFQQLQQGGGTVALDFGKGSCVNKSFAGNLKGERKVGFRKSWGGEELVFSMYSWIFAAVART